MAGLDDKLGPLIGARSARALEKAFGYVTARDLLFHLPRRLDDRGQLTDIAALKEGEPATILARVQDARPIRYQSRQPGRGTAVRVEVRLTDGNATLTATFFGSAWRAKQLPPGTVAYFSGTVDTFRGQRQLVHPVVEVLSGASGREGMWSATVEVDESLQRWWPVYSAAAGMTSMAVLRCVRALLPLIDPIADFVPDEVRRRRGLMTLDDAVRHAHQPDDPDDFWRARTRLRHDEAFILQTALVYSRAEATARPAIPRPTVSGGLLDAFDAALPFVLTGSQRSVGEQIAADLSRQSPMQRLLQGEVGSGKTVVALRAALQVIDTGGQAALLAPTEVLAQQHYRSITDILGPLAQGGMLGGDAGGTQVELLTGSTPPARRRRVLAGMESGEVGLLVGTHALLEASVVFRELGLVVVDEQHRFGVEQRSAMLAKGAGQHPHLLVMTATPIPRTVALTVFGDLDTSELRELPAGRQPVQTTVVPREHPSWMARAWERVREEVAAGHQAYVVCPRIGDDQDPSAPQPDDDMAARAPLGVAEIEAELSGGPLAGLRLAMLHGRMPADEKDLVMRAFAVGTVDVLVSTTVIEVGVDVPNATVMVVMDAERFGVSSLHQLRGRIGRGSSPGLCLLVSESPADSPGRRRLEAVAATSDGFEIAQLDLETRREGDILGVLQSGRRSSLRLLSVVRHADLIATAREDAARVLAGDPRLEQHRGLAGELARLFADQRSAYLEKT